LRHSNSVGKRSDNRSNQGRGIGDAERLERQRRVTDTDDGHSRRRGNAVGRERVGVVVNGTRSVYDFKRLGVERERNARGGRDHSSSRVVFGVLLLRRVRDVGMASTCEQRKLRSTSGNKTRQHLPSFAPVRNSSLRAADGRPGISGWDLPELSSEEACTMKERIVGEKYAMKGLAITHQPSQIYGGTAFESRVPEGKDVLIEVTVLGGVWAVLQIFRAMHLPFSNLVDTSHSLPLASWASSRFIDLVEPQ
jgi:hypothetical protein